MNDNNTIVFEDNQFETVVGDEKQPDFYPRVKVKRWDNEANFSVGLLDNSGDYEVNDETITYTDNNIQAIFEPTKQKELDSSSIRYIYSGETSPNRIAALYELDREIEWYKQTINAHYPDRYSMMYFGYYPRDKFIDPNKLDLDECRLSAWQVENGPMVMDDGLLMIDIHYDTRRDDLTRMNQSMKAAITNVVQRYGVHGITENPKGLKLYFTNQDGNPVKFFSTAFISGHYYFYINLNTDYNASHKYYRDDVLPQTEDELAYGLRVEHTLPDTKSFCDEVIAEYAKVYGANLTTDTLTAEEIAIVDRYEQILSSREWIENARRSDPYYVTAWDKEQKGFLFDIIMDAKPLTNIVPLSIKYKKLRFLKQPEIIEDGVWQEPRVVNSYAVYHEEEKSDEKYLTGKAFHIYRPWIQDANNNRVWCDLEIDEDNETADIIIPQDFLDNATYPVYIDPTFGYTSAGASSSDCANTITGSVFATGGFEVSSITAYIGWAGSISASYSFGLYDNSDNTIKVQMSGSSGVQNQTAWVTLNSTDSSTYVMNNAILVSWGTISAYSPSILFYYDADASVGYRLKSSTYGASFPSPATWDTSTTGRKYSIYATVTINPRNVNLSDGTSQKKGIRIWP